MKAGKKGLLQKLQKDRYLVRTPSWLKKLYPGCLWDMEQKKNTLYLTFDDGPHPVITPWVLDELKKYQAKATFFCIGKNVLDHPEIYQRILDEGHAVGNHTHRHLNGWKTSDTEYFYDIKVAADHISSRLFRPPYGRIKKSQLKRLTTGPEKMSVVMWNILAGDWDPSIDAHRCYERMKRKIREGDIIVFHDSEKAMERMKYALGKLLEEYSNKNFVFKTI